MFLINVDRFVKNNYMYGIIFLMFLIIVLIYLIDISRFINNLFYRYENFCIFVGFEIFNGLIYFFLDLVRVIFIDLMILFWGLGYDGLDS